MQFNSNYERLLMNKIEDKPIIIAKLVIYAVLIVLIIIMYVLLPKELIKYDDIYEFATATANVNEEEIVLYDYKVYSTNSRYEAGLENDVLEVLNKFKERGEALAIRVRGETKKIEYKDSYWIIYDPDAIELNIEYYIIPNFKVGNNVLPIRSAVGLVNNLTKKITIIYLCVFTIIFASCLVPPTIGVTKRVVYLIKNKKN